MMNEIKETDAQFTEADLEKFARFMADDPVVDGVHPETGWFDDGIPRCRCGRPIEHAIGGELRCEECYSAGEDPIDPALAAEIAWYRSHCQDCGKPLSGGGMCPRCQAEADSWLESTGGWNGA
jgi:hypothetical protein